MREYSSAFIHNVGLVSQAHSDVYILMLFAGAPTLFSEVDYSNRTYPRFVLPGWGHIVAGLLLIAVGIIDLGMSNEEYSHTTGTNIMQLTIKIKMDLMHKTCNLNRDLSSICQSYNFV